MNVRFGLVLAVSLSLVTGACASGGGGGDSGVSPRDDEHTTAAQLFLTQAQTAENEAAAAEAYQRALDTALEGVQADSTNPRAYWQAGLAAARLGNYEQADSLLSQATDLYPDYEEDVMALREEAWVEAYNSAIEPLNRGELEEAIELFEAANQIFPGRRAEAYLNLGATYARLGNSEEAAVAYQGALDVIQGDAIERVDSATAAQWRENEQLAVFNLGQALAQSGQFEEAVGAYEDYLERNPEDVAAISNLAVVLVNAEMPDSAMALYNDLLVRDDLSSRDYFAAGVGLYQIERYDRAIEAFRGALELNPDSRDALFNLAQTLFTTEEWEELEQVTERVLEVDPHNSNIYKMRAKALVEVGDQQAAGRVIEELQALPFELSGLQLQPVTSGGASISGVVTNRALDQGTPIVIRAHFSGPEGQAVGTQETTIQAPAPDDSSQFQIEFSSDQEVDGYWYEVVQP